MRGTQWAGIGMLALGVGSFGMARSIARNDAEDRRIATAQASYAQGRCTITAAEAVDWRHDKPDEVIRGATIETTLTVHAATGDVKDVAYRYPDTYWNPISAKQAVATTHKPGSSITCFYDAAKPENAVLVQRGMPAEPGTSPWVMASIFGIPLLLMGLIALLVKPDGKKRLDD